MVQDGETLAIGGIIAERVNRNRLGILFLMHIPVFSRFFGTTRDDIDRTELIILITPHVIRSKEEGRTVTEEFKERLSTVKRELEKNKGTKEQVEVAPSEPAYLIPGGNQGNRGNLAPKGTLL